MREIRNFFAWLDFINLNEVAYILGLSIAITCWVIGFALFVRWSLS